MADSDRAERLRQRRRGGRTRGGGSDESVKQVQRDEPDKPDKPDETDGRDQPDGQGSGSVKAERDGGEVYMWLPDSQKQRLSAEFKLKDAHLAAEFGVDIEKNRHFYPAVIEFGLGQIEEWDAEEFRDALVAEGLLVA